MGFFDKMKGMMNAVTGGSATVTIEYPAGPFFAGDVVPVKVVATSTGQEVKSKGVFIDLREVERISLKKRDEQRLADDLDTERQVSESNTPIAPAFVLAAGQSMEWTAQIQLPATAGPSYNGKHATHEWAIRGRVEAFGNDPDSGFKPIRVGSR